MSQIPYVNLAAAGRNVGDSRTDLPAH